MSNTVGLLLLILMIGVGIYLSKKERNEKNQVIIDRNKQHRDEVVQICIDYYRKIKEIVPNKTNDEYDAIGKQGGFDRIIYNVTWEQINRGIENK